MVQPGLLPSGSLAKLYHRSLQDKDEQRGGLEVCGKDIEQTEREVLLIADSHARHYNIDLPHLQNVQFSSSCLPSRL